MFVFNYKAFVVKEIKVDTGIVQEILFRGRPRVYIKDIPLHTLIEVMDAISKKDHVDSPFH
ncbi:hypothetical protein T08_4706 [Trichinella sp. T8]|nr:hypothetical protein T08_4706 [Trichinella sp. T8]